MYTKLLRLHDIIYFLWKGKWIVGWWVLKWIAILASLGIIISFSVEISSFLRDTYEDLKPEGLELEKKAPAKVVKKTPLSAPWQVRPRWSDPKPKTE